MVIEKGTVKREKDVGEYIKLCNVLHHNSDLHFRGNAFQYAMPCVRRYIPPQWKFTIPKSHRHRAKERNWTLMCICDSVCISRARSYRVTSRWNLINLIEQNEILLFPNLFFHHGSLWDEKSWCTNWNYLI